MVTVLPSINTVMLNRAIACFTTIFSQIFLVKLVITEHHTYAKLRKKKKQPTCLKPLYIILISDLVNFVSCNKSLSWTVFLEFNAKRFLTASCMSMPYSANSPVTSLIMSQNSLWIIHFSVDRVISNANLAYLKRKDKKYEIFHKISSNCCHLLLVRVFT